MGDRRRKTRLQGKLTSSTSTGPPEADPDSTESGMTLQLGYFVLTYIRPFGPTYYLDCTIWLLLVICFQLIWPRSSGFAHTVPDKMQPACR